MSEPSFYPIRPTRVRELRPGDHIIVPTDGPGAGSHALITDLKEDESTRLITINGEFVGEEALFYHQAPPHETVQRLVQPGDPIPGTESIMVRGSELWKWIGATFNDPQGTAEQYRIRTFRHIADPVTGEPIAEVEMNSLRHSSKVLTIHVKLNATIGFPGCR
ncbi:hypothetical protein ACIHDR_43080 [Nocardia sp. NPDC052278]|uniref:hypothetical protein n=1 Tax=unclassified Nocardia TaxID=2637762 RepID=UPI00368CA5C6